jgi:molybdopterin-guanine dinucleotide biosynthesis protein A
MGDSIVTTVPVVIPAHGHGSRMRPVTGGAPKTLTPVGGQPILGRLLAAVRQVGRPAVVYAQPPGQLIEAYLATLPGPVVPVRYRRPEGALPDTVAIFAAEGDELTILDADMAVPHADLCAFLAATRDTDADLLAGQSALPPSRDPRSIRLIPGSVGRLQVGAGEDSSLPRTCGAYHWRPPAVAAARAFLRDGQRTFHEFIGWLATRDGQHVRVATFAFSAAVNVNTPAEHAIADAEAARWDDQQPAATASVREARQ